jgi:uncharacterized membrane protein YbhN (UPF0104 family)
MLVWRKRTIIGTIAGLLISLVTLWLVVRWAGWTTLSSHFLELNYSMIALSVLFYLVSMAMRTLAWRMMLGEGLSFWQVLGALNEGYLLNNVLPLRMGEIGRAVLVGKKPGLTIPGALSSIMVERLFDVALALSLFLGLLPYAAGLEGIGQNSAFAFLFLILALLVVVLAWWNPAWFDWIIARLPGGRQLWQPLWLRFREGLQQFRSGRRFVLSLLFMLTSWLLAGFEYWFMLKAVIPEAELLWAFFMLTVTLIGVAVPSLPGYIGVFEAAGVVALSVFNVPASQALVATLLLHGMVYLVASSIGLVALLGEGETLTLLVNQVRDWIVANEPNTVDPS